MIPNVFPALLWQAAPTGGGGALTGLFVQMGLIFAIFYFLMIRPRRKQMQQHEERLRNLRKGDQIVTEGLQTLRPGGAVRTAEQQTPAVTEGS